MSQLALFGRNPNPTGAGEATGDGEAKRMVALAPDAAVQRGTEALPDLAWAHLDHDGARWRHRLHEDRLGDRPAEQWPTAPGRYRWELEKLVDGEWREVPYVQRRDELWAKVGP